MRKTGTTGSQVEFPKYVKGGGEFVAEVVEAPREGHP